MVFRFPLLNTTPASLSSSSEPKHRRCRRRHHPRHERWNGSLKFRPAIGKQWTRCSDDTRNSNCSSKMQLLRRLQSRRRMREPRRKHFRLRRRRRCCCRCWSGEELRRRRQGHFRFRRPPRASARDSSEATCRLRRSLAKELRSRSLEGSFYHPEKRKRQFGRFLLCFSSLPRG